MKKYIAKTNVSINIVLPSGANRHIAFSALTGGGSVYYTDEPEIIQAIERHYKYGKLFRIDPSYAAEEQMVKAPSKAKATDKTEECSELESSTKEEAGPKCSEGGNEEGEEAEGTKKVVVSDPDAAKAYLAEHFGYSRTKLKTIKAIKEAAANSGVEFEGI